VVKIAPRLFPTIDLPDAQVFVEAPLVGRGGVSSTLPQAYVSGALQGALWSRGANVSLVNVSRWKKVVIGKGNATKANVAEAVRLRWPDLYRRTKGDADCIDAVAIALYGLVQVSGPEVLDGLRGL
jgi:Holliday junction resolvasome RuvABC endonuclease subunit